MLKSYKTIAVLLCALIVSTCFPSSVFAKSTIKSIFANDFETYTANTALANDATGEAKNSFQTSSADVSVVNIDLNNCAKINSTNGTAYFITSNMQPTDFQSGTYITKVSYRIKANQTADSSLPIVSTAKSGLSFRLPDVNNVWKPLLIENNRFKVLKSDNTYTEVSIFKTTQWCDIVLYFNTNNKTIERLFINNALVASAVAQPKDQCNFDNGPVTAKIDFLAGGKASDFYVDDLRIERAETFSPIPVTVLKGSTNNAAWYSEVAIDATDTLQLARNLIPIKINGVLSDDTSICNAISYTEDTAPSAEGMLSLANNNTIDFDFSSVAFDGHRSFKDLTIFTTNSASNITLQYSTMENPTVFSTMAISLIPQAKSNFNYQKFWCSQNLDEQIKDINTLRILVNNTGTAVTQIGEIDIHLLTEPQSIIDARDVALSDISVPTLFSNNTILQQKMAIPVWGVGGGKDGNTVSVRVAGQVKTALVKDYKWKVMLDPLTATLSDTMTITGPTNTITISNVAIGEVFIAGGQSNMQRKISAMEGFQAAEMPTEMNPNIRYFSNSLGSNRNQERKNMNFGSWSQAGPETVPNYTAVGYICGRELQKKLGVPVGIIYTPVGGSNIQTFMQYSDLVETGDLDFATDEKETLAQYSDFKVSIYTHTAGYYGIIKPLQPFGVRGVLWYQGESNAGEASFYKKMYIKMVNSWREGFNNPNMFFLNVQLAPYEKGNYAAMRDAQIYNMYSIPNVATVVITDTITEPGAFDIHPDNKRPVGERLALAARGLIYGEDTEFLSPLFKSMTISSGACMLSFNHVGKGLKLKDGDSDLIGFEISADGKNFVTASATILDTDQVKVWNSSVPHPTVVRFGWGNIPVGNLYNDIGLPASPFNTSTIPASVIKDIKQSVRIQSVNVTTVTNVGATLPNTVKMLNSDGSSTDVNVVWDKSAVGFTSSEIGKYVVYGTVPTNDAFFYRATANINVINPPYTLSNLNVDNGSISVNLKNNTTDAKTVNVIYAVYKKNKLVGIKMSPQNLTASETKTLTYTVSVTWDTIKTFVFDPANALVDSAKFQSSID